MSNKALEHKQPCADRAQAIVQHQVNVLREIQRMQYLPTPGCKERLDHLIAEYDHARTEYEAASLACDIPAYVVPVRSSRKTTHQVTGNAKP